MSAQVIRPEFSLIETKVDYTTARGIKIIAGTIIARLFYPAGYVFSNPTAGKSVVYDSWSSPGFGFTGNKKTRVIEMVATKKLVEFLSDETRTVANNMAVNRVRTVKLAGRLLKSQVQAVRNTSNPVSVSSQETVRVTRELERFHLFNPWFTATEPKVESVSLAPIQYQLCLPLPSAFDSNSNVQNDKPLVTSRAAIFANDWTNEELWACNIKQLKVIAKKLNLKVYGTKAEIIAKIKLSY